MSAGRPRCSAPLADSFGRAFGILAHVQVAVGLLAEIDAVAEHVENALLAPLVKAVGRRRIAAAVHLAGDAAAGQTGGGQRKEDANGLNLDRLVRRQKPVGADDVTVVDAAAVELALSSALDAGAGDVGRKSFRVGRAAGVLADGVQHAVRVVLEVDPPFRGEHARHAGVQ